MRFIGRMRFIVFTCALLALGTLLAPVISQAKDMDVRSRSDGGVDVNFPNGCFIPYDRNGNRGGHSGSCKRKQFERADEAVESHFNNYGNDMGENSKAGEIACSSYRNEFNRCPLPNAGNLNVKLIQNLGDASCRKDYTWGADSDGVWVDKGCSAVFSYSGSGNTGAQANDRCPSDLSGNECEYYKDGYAAGAEDGRNGMSSFYGRHSGGYDSRFEPYFARGYEAGWRDYR
jgi:hypothetical protein